MISNLLVSLIGRNDAAVGDAPAIIYGSLSPAAFGLRQLNPLTPNCFRVRRASDNAETDIGFSAGLVDWAGAIAFKGVSTLFISKLYDQSGNGKHAIQTDNAKQPGLDTSGEEITFDGWDDFLETSPLSLSALDKLTFLSVVKNNEIFATRTYFEVSADALTENGFHLWSFSYNAFVRNCDGVNINNRYYPNNQSVFDLYSGVIDRTQISSADQLKSYDSQAAMIYQNQLDVTVGNFADQPLYIGAKAGTSEFLNGGLKELIILGDALNDTDRSNAEDDINAFYTVF